MSLFDLVVCPMVPSVCSAPMPLVGAMIGVLLLCMMCMKRPSRTPRGSVGLMVGMLTPSGPR